MKRWDSFNSTESFSGDEFESAPKEHVVAPYDLYYTLPETQERVLVAKDGEALPIETTKYKKKSSWDYALKFR